MLGQSAQAELQRSEHKPARVIACLKHRKSKGRGGRVHGGGGGEGGRSCSSVGFSGQKPGVRGLNMGGKLKVAVDRANKHAAWY